MQAVDSTPIAFAFTAPVTNPAPIPAVVVENTPMAAEAAPANSASSDVRDKGKAKVQEGERLGDGERPVAAPAAALEKKFKASRSKRRNAARKLLRAKATAPFPATEREASVSGETAAPPAEQAAAAQIKKRKSDKPRGAGVGKLRAPSPRAGSSPQASPKSKAAVAPRPQGKTPAPAAKVAAAPNPSPSVAGATEAAEVARPKPRKPPTFMGNLKSLKIPFSGKATIRDKLKESTQLHVYSPEGSHNPHGVSAFYRYAATSYALGRLHAEGCREVMSVYGSMRDHKITERLNKGVEQADRLSITIHRPLTVARDIARMPDARVPVEQDLTRKDQMMGFLMNDIYQFGAVPFSPQVVLDLLGAGSERVLYWIGHRFNGAMGTIHGEGAWFRTIVDGEQLICSKSDNAVGTQEYPLHDPLDWMTQAGRHECGVAWSQVHIFGEDTYVFKFVAKDIPQAERFANAEPAFILKDSLIYEKSPLARMLLPLGGVPSFLKRFVSCEKVLIDVALLNEIRRWMHGRNRTPFGFKEVCKWASDRATARSVCKIFPEQTAKIVLSTVREAFYGDAKTLEWETANLNATYAASLYNVNAAQMAVAEKSPYGWLRHVAGGVLIAFALVGCYLLGQRLKHMLSMLPSSIKLLIMRSLSRAPRVTSGGPLDQFAGQMAKADPVVSWTRPTAEAIVNLVFLTPLMEEAFKRIPFIGKYYGLFEYGCRLLQGGLMGYGSVPSTATTRDKFSGVLQGTGWMGLRALPALAMHHFTRKLPYLQAVCIHSMFNCYSLIANNPPTPGSFADIWRGLTGGSELSSTMKNHFNLTNLPWAMRLVPNPMDLPIGARSFDPAISGIPSSPTSHFEQKTLDSTVQVIDNLSHEVEPQTYERTYWMLPTPVPWQRPGRTDENLRAVVYGRLAILPPCPPDVQARHWAWPPLAKQKVVVPAWGPIVVTEELEAEWLEHFSGAKRRRAQEALESNRTNPLRASDKECQKAQVMVKTDEILFKQDLEGYLQMKPRAIINVSPKVQAATGPSLLEATRRLKEDWPWDVIQRGSPQGTGNYFHKSPVYEGEPPRRFYVTYGADATDQKLTRWLDQALAMPPNCYCILVAGDDSVVVGHNNEGHLIVAEGDASMYDQSQSAGPLKHELEVLLALGVSVEICNILWAVYNAEYEAVSRHKEGPAKMRVKHPKRPMRATGGPDTSLGNTMIMGLTWVHALSYMANPRDGLDAREHCRERFAYYGFDMKMAPVLMVTDLTFLKGMWYQTKHNTAWEYVWGPLPSRFLKLGKSMKDPRQIYAMKDLRGAAHKFLGDLAQSYRPFVAVPLIADFVLRYYREREGTYEPSRAEMQYVVSDGELSLVEIAPFDQLERRYGIEAGQWWQMARLIRESHPFQFLSHPGFLIMAQRDYA